MSEINSRLFRADPAAYYTELGAQAERERIIKLLIEEGVLTPRSNEDENDQQIIELIKGETK